MTPGLAAALLWSPCPDLGEGAECTTVSVPEDHERPESGELLVALRRVPAPAGRARGQLWYLPDGPGQSGITRARGLGAVHEAIAPDLDLLTLDPRGVGFSGRLGCRSEESEQSPAGAALTAEEWSACAARWGADRDALRPYTTTQAATDLVFVMGQARETGPVFAWAQGYGAYVLDRTSTIVHDGLVDAVLVDGAMPADWSATELDATMDSAGRGLAERCGVDPGCAARVDDDPAALAVALMARLDDGHCAEAHTSSDEVRSLGAHLMRAGAPWAQHLPAVWARLDRFRASDVEALDTFRRSVPAPAIEAPVLARQILLTDLWDEPGSVARLEAIVGNSIVSEGRAVELARAEWPYTGPGELHRAEPQVGVPLLMLHGGLDPQVTPAAAQARADQLQGAQQRLVHLPQAFGRPVEHSGCAQELAAAFLADPTGPVDADCATSEEPLSFAADPEQDELLWGQRSRYGRPGCQTAGGAPWLAFVCVTLFLRRRQHRGRWSTVAP